MNFKNYLAIAIILSLNSALFCVTRSIQSETEFSKILKSKRPQVVKFYADWCGACKNMKPAFEKVANDINNKSVDFNTIQIDLKDTKDKDKDVFANTLKEYTVTGVPKTLFIKNGKVVDSLPGCPATSRCVEVLNQKVDALLGRESKAPKPQEKATSQESK